MESKYPKRQYSEVEWQARVDLAAAYRLVDLFGWSDLVSTHISAHVPGAERHFLINPFGMLFDEITASSLVKIDLDGNIVEPTDFIVNPAGFIIHSAIHMADSKNNCVFHTHTPAGIGVATQRDGLLPITQQALLVLGDLAYHDYESAAFNPEERARLLADLGDRHILVLRNHGMLTVGSTVAEAFMHLYNVERACRMQLAFQGAGVPHYPIPQDVVDLTIETGNRIYAADGVFRAGDLMWPGLIRKLNRISPGYRT